MKWSVVAFAGVATATEVTPVQKVVQLMQGMLEKGKKEKHEEQVQFASYKQFCDDTSVEKARAIEEANQRIEKLNADIQKAETDARQLAKEIAQHDADIATFEGDKAAGTKVREIEKADYDTTHKDYSESIDALGRAINVLKEQDHDRAQASLLQVQHLMTNEQKKVITSFLATDPEVMFQQDPPSAHGYEFQSGGVIEMLEGLLDKFEDEQTSLEKKETNSTHAYDMLMQDLAAEISHNQQARTEKSEAKGAKLQAAADAKGDLADTTATRDDDQKYLSDLTATCEQKASDFENRQQLRADEIVAIEKAIEIISSGAVSGAADKHLPALAQTSFIQVKSTQKGMSVNAIKALTYIKTRAKQLNSRVLAQLASSVQMGDDPFKKVKKLIQDLIVRLMEQANEEAEQKGYCDTELATNEMTRKEKTHAVEKLHAEIDQLQSSIAKLTEDVQALTTAVAELDKAMAQATSLRSAEKEKNTQTIKDSKEAQAAVAQALQVLKEFYAKAGQATSLLQQQPESPEIFDESYQGMQSESGGVVGMLEVIESDFARLEADTTAGEATSQKEFDGFMTDSAVDKAQKNKDIEHKSAKKQNEGQALQEKKGDLDGTQKELDAALNYFDKLKPQCIDTGVSYEDRVQRREEEVESLQEALKILNGEDLA